MKATTDAPAPMDTRTEQEKQRDRNIEELWTIVTQLQLDVKFVKQLLREWQGD